MAGTFRNPLAEFDDPLVVARLIAGDEDEHNRLYEAALPVLSALVRRMFKGESGEKVFTDDEANMIASDAIMAARESIARFDPTRREPLPALLVTIALNKARDRIRWRKSSNRDPLDRPDTVFMDNPDSVESPLGGTATPQPLSIIPKGTEVFAEKQVESLRAVAKRLPAAEKRQVFAEKLTEQERHVLLWKMEEVSDKDIAQRLGTTDNNVRVIRNRALNKWAKELKRRLETDER